MTYLLPALPSYSLKLHHEKRPLSMKTDIIKKRQRYENGPSAPKGKSSRKVKQEEGASSPGYSDDNESSENNDSKMEYEFQQYPQNNNNQSSGSGSLMMTGY